MEKILVLGFSLLLLSNMVFAGQATTTKNYKLNQYNSKGQKVGYTKVYYQNNKSNVKKVEKYSTNGRRTEVYR